MHELYEIKDMLMDELKQYANKGELTSSTLEVVDKLSHSIKNICKIIDAYEEDEGYSGNYPIYGGSYRMNHSYARGRRGNVRRDSMGRYSRDDRYSRDGGMIEELKELMHDAPNDQIKMEMQKLVTKMEQM